MSTQPPPTRRRWLFPVALLLLSACAVALPDLWEWADLDPSPRSAMELSGKFVALGCWLIVAVWFFAFSGLSSRVKLATLSVLLLLAAGGVAAVAEVDVDGNLRPIFHYRWEPRPQDALARHLEEAATPSGLPRIDLTVDLVSDFPRYRGLRGDGIVTPVDLLEFDWSKKAPEPLWRQPCGGGFSGFAVAGNVAVTLEQRGEDEVVVCYDRGTGRQRWAHSYPARFHDFTGDGPRSTPTIHKGRVYSLGATGELVCLEGTTGKKRWAVNVVEDCEAKVVTWGITSSPLIVDDLGLVVVNPGIDPKSNAEKAVAAYRLEDGRRAWANGKYAAGYSSPLLVTLAGRKQVLLFDAGGLAGFDPKSGKELWRHEWTTFQGMNIIQPLVLDKDRVFLSSEASNGCAMLQVTSKGGRFSADVLWANKQLASKFANPIAVGGSIYGLSTGTLVCLDADTGRRNWRGKYYGHGQMLSLGGALLVLSERGYVALVAADRKEFRELARMEVFKDKTWNTPAVAGRQLFVRNDREMACFELPVRD